MRCLPSASNAGTGAGALHCKAANAASSMQQLHKAAPSNGHRGSWNSHGGPRQSPQATFVTAAVAERLEASTAQPRLVDATLQHDSNQHVREGHYEAELVQLQVCIGA